MHLRYHLQIAHQDCNEDRHALVVMKELGITYQHATPQSMGDCWWFWNCENIPEQLPEFIGELDADPMEAVGWGLYQEEAELIRDYQPLTGE